MSTTTGPLNPEPSQPQERLDQNLAPKSYATALTEPLEDQQTQFQNRKQTYQNSLSSSITSQGVPTSPSLTWTTSGTKTPTNDETEIYEKHVDGNGHVLTSLKRDDSYAESLRHDELIAPRRKSGDRSPNKEHKGKKDEPEGTSQLKTGRRAGAGWERSAYVLSILTILVNCTDKPSDVEFDGRRSTCLSKDAYKLSPSSGTVYRSQLVCQYSSSLRLYLWSGLSLYHILSIP